MDTFVFAFSVELATRPRTSFSESFLPYGKGVKIYELLLENELGEAIVNSGRTIYNLNIPRFLSLSKCEINLANIHMKNAAAWMPGLVRADDFYYCVDPSIRGTYACVSLENKRELFYKYSHEQARPAFLLFFLPSFLPAAPNYCVISRCSCASS